MRIKIRLLIMIIIILTGILLTGCWNSREVNKLSISIAIGIDKTATGYLISEQVVNPKTVATTRTVTQETSIIEYTAQSENIVDAVNSFPTLNGRSIYSMHLRVVIISEEVAREGLKDIIDYFMRSPEYRSDFYYIIAKGASAKETLSILSPMGTLPAMAVYESLNLTTEELASSKEVKSIELINNILSEGMELVLPVLQITEGTNASDSLLALQQSDVIKKLKISGLGVFKKDQLVGWLNDEESKGYNYITGNLKASAGYTQDSNIEISYKVQSSRSKIKALLDKENPSIDVSIELYYNIEAVKGDLDVSKEENKKKINNLVAADVRRICEKTVSKAQNDLKADVFGFGEEIHRQYPKYWQTVKDVWYKRFTDLPVSITVKADIKNYGEIGKSFFIKKEE